MVHLICQEEFEAMDRVNALYDKWLDVYKRQLRTVIVTAAVYWGLNSKLRLR